MPREPKINYFESRGAYYTQIKKVQHCLASGPKDGPDGPTYTAARKAFNKLMDLQSLDIIRGRSTLETVLAAWQDDQCCRWQPAYVAMVNRHCESLCAELGRVEIGRFDLRAWYTFLQAKRGPARVQTGISVKTVLRADGWERNIYKTLHAALAWAMQRDFITKDPLKGYRPPAVRSRSVAAMTSKDEHQKALAALTSGRRRAFRDMVIALHGTGARPSELFAAETRYWDESRQAIVYLADERRPAGQYRHKTAGKGKDRIIRFRGEALEVIRRLLKRHPTGPLFRTSKGKKWKRKELCRQFNLLLRPATGNDSLTPYSYRHTFATEWLVAGQPIELLAEWLGNSPEVIRRHYKHLLSRETEMDVAFDRFLSGRNVD